MGQLVLSQEFFVVFGGSWFLRLWGLGQWGQGINGKFPVVGVFFLEVVSWFNLGIAVLQNLDEAGDNLFYFVLRELRTYPDDETGYFGHRGLSPLWSRNYIKTLLCRGRQALLQ